MKLFWHKKKQSEKQPKKIKKKYYIRRACHIWENIYNDGVKDHWYVCPTCESSDIEQPTSDCSGYCNNCGENLCR